MVHGLGAGVVSGSATAGLLIIKADFLHRRLAPFERWGFTDELSTLLGTMATAFKLGSGFAMTSHPSALLSTSVDKCFNTFIVMYFSDPAEVNVVFLLLEKVCPGLD